MTIKIAAIFANVVDKSAMKDVISKVSGLGSTGTNIVSPGYILFNLPRKNVTYLFLHLPF